MIQNNVPKKLAILNDLSGYGRCSLSVELPVVSALGVQACPVPTAVLSNHTAFPKEYKVDFTDHMRPFLSAWEDLGLSFDGVITGYMNYEEQVKAAAEFIDAVRSRAGAENPVIFVDPAMADHGVLYRGFSPEYADFIKENLISRATVIKPNITEACILTGFPYEEIVSASREHTMRRLKSHLMNLMDSLQNLGPENIVITGIEREDKIINAVSDGQEVRFMATKKSGQNRPGTGDIFCAITCACLMKGMCLTKAVRKASDFIATAIRISDEAGVPANEGVIFENILSKLSATADSL